MGGAFVIYEFLENDLVDKLIIFVVNKELKKGIKLDWKKYLGNFQKVKEENIGDITNFTYDKKS